MTHTHRSLLALSNYIGEMGKDLHATNQAAARLIWDAAIKIEAAASELADASGEHDTIVPSAPPSDDGAWRSEHDRKLDEWTNGNGLVMRVSQR